MLMPAFPSGLLRKGCDFIEPLLHPQALGLPLALIDLAENHIVLVFFVELLNLLEELHVSDPHLLGVVAIEDGLLELGLCVKCVLPSKDSDSIDSL